MANGTPVLGGGGGGGVSAYAAWVVCCLRCGLSEQCVQTGFAVMGVLMRTSQRSSDRGREHAAAEHCTSGTFSPVFVQDGAGLDMADVGCYDSDCAAIDSRSRRGSVSVQGFACRQTCPSAIANQSFNVRSPSQLNCSNACSKSRCSQTTKFPLLPAIRKRHQLRGPETEFRQTKKQLASQPFGSLMPG